MPIKPKPSAKSIAKQKKIKKLLELLKTEGPLRSSEIVKSSKDLTIVVVNNYLSELILSGHIRKVQAKDAPKNIYAYQFESECGTKTDIVSLALSHPLNRLTFSMVEKKQAKNTVMSGSIHLD